MDNNFRERNENKQSMVQRSRHIVMGVLFIVMGILMLVAYKYKIQQLLDFDTTSRNIFGSIFTIYGLFRLYRGTKKDY